MIDFPTYKQFTPDVLRTLFKRYMKEAKAGKAHAVLSASGSERWLGCPGSVQLSDGLPQVDNEHSIRGTNTHTLFQFLIENPKYKWLLDRPEAKAFKAHIGFDQAMYENAIFATNFVNTEKRELERETGNPVHLMVEKKVELSGVGFGTADIILHQPFGVLHVMDYKNGQKIVDPEDNTQGLYYAVAAADLHGWDFDHVKITIIQPNAAHKRGPIRTWTTTLERLEKAAQHLRVGAKRTKKEDAPLVVDAKWCWFCPARSICPEQMKGKESKIMDRFQKPGRGINGKEKIETKKARSQKGEAKDFCDTF